MADVTYDTVFNGTVRVIQPMHGYRFSIDAFLLAALPNPKSGDKLLDMGTGCGIIPLVLASRFHDIHITGVEVQAELVRLAEMNVTCNNMTDRITILHHDLRTLTMDKIGGPVDWVISNPPYRPACSGRINPNSQKALARHEINVNLKELMKSSRRFLRTGGRFGTIYPSERTVDLFSEMRKAGIEPKTLQCVHSRTGDGAKLVLVQGIIGGKPGLKISPPLMIYEADGEYSKAVQAMMAPEGNVGFYNSNTKMNGFEPI